MEPNCERHPTRAATYIVYDASGYAFRVIRRPGYCAGRWQAHPSHAGAKGDHRYFVADTLAALARKVGASKREA